MQIDPIADVLTRIRNAQHAHHESVEVYLNNTTEPLLSILKSEGFIEGYTAYKNEKARMAKIDLRYYKAKPVITGIERVSKPGRRIYSAWKDIKSTRNNMGISIYSTPKGILTDKDAKFQHVGGEHLCRVW